MITLRTLLDADWLDASLRRGGLMPSARSRVGWMFNRMAQHLQAHGRGAETPVHACFVPGRVEVLGKHTDYAGGRSIVGALQRGLCLIAIPSAETAIRVTDLSRGTEGTVDLNRAQAPHAKDWTRYLETVAHRLVKNFPGALKGGELFLMSNLPPAAGMSSSSAMVVGLFLMLGAINNLKAHPAYRQHIVTPLQLAEYLGTIENGQSYKGLKGRFGVGTFGGSQDHTAILCSRSGAVQQFAYAPTRHERTIPWPNAFQWVVGVSGVHARKLGDAQQAYNWLSRSAQAIVQAWQGATGETDVHLAAVLANPRYSPSSLLEALKSHAPDGFDPNQLRARFKHFLVENEEIIPMAVDALMHGDWVRFGDTVDRSQEAAIHLLGNQIPQTILLAQSARSLGAIAATSFGSGFGGAVWAMVDRDRAEGFMEQWKNHYIDAFPGLTEGTSFFRTEPGPSAFMLRDS